MAHHHRSFPFNGSFAISLRFSYYHPEKTNYIAAHILHYLRYKNLTSVTFALSLERKKKTITLMLSLPEKRTHLKFNVFPSKAISAEFSMTLLQQSSYQIS